MNNDNNRNENAHASNSNESFTSFSPVTDNNGFSTPPAPLKHSGLGIASFVLALASLLGIVLSLVLSASFASQFINADPAEIERIIEGGDGEVAAIMGVGLLIIASLGLSFVGLILGVIGAFMKSRKKVFSIIGIVLNGLIVIGSIFLFIIGIALGSAV